MRQFWMGASVLVLGLTVSSTATAQVIVRARVKVVAPRPVVVAARPGRAYYAVHGTRFAGGWFYAGINHRHWTYTCWSRRYRCAFYWDPYLRCYYYWYQPAGCFYPVTYLQTAPPVVSATAAPLVGAPIVDGFPPPPPSASPAPVPSPVPLP